MGRDVHPTAIIDPDTTIGEAVSIGPYSIVESDVQIGEGCEIGSHVVIGSGTRIGSRCRVFTGACLGLIPQDLKFEGEKTYLRIGDNTTVREYATLNRGTKARGETRIGRKCLIMAYCHIGHDCLIGDEVILANNLAMAGHVEVGNYATIGGIVPVHQFVRIGDYAYVGASSRPFTDIVPFALVGPEPTRIVGINKIGLERRGFDSDRRQEINRAFRVLFRRNLSLESAIEKLQKTFPQNQDVRMIISFAKGASRGIMRMKEAG